MTACGPSVEPEWQPSDADVEAEISPGVFVPIYIEHGSSEGAGRGWTMEHLFSRKGRYSESIALKTDYQGKRVNWYGGSLPVCLREHEGSLFLITFDRTTHKTARAFFRYHRQQDNSFVEIPPKEFPRSIAVNNLMFGKGTMMTDEGPLDEMKVERDQDPQNVHFRRSLTACIRHELMTGETYYVARNRDISAESLEKYQAEFKPARLTCGHLRTPEERRQGARPDPAAPAASAAGR